MALTIRQTTAGHAWVARPNHALSSRQKSKLLLATAGIAGVIAFIFAAFGAWPVLPFAGIEIAALWLALHYLQRHADDEERLEVTERNVTFTRISCGRQQHWQFDRYWLQLRSEESPFSADSRLFLRSHGKDVEIGQLLTAAQRKELARELRTKLGRQ